MKIAGLQKMTLLDYPGKVACTVFIQGCNFRCPFCHNSDLLGAGEAAFMTEDALLSFLEKRTGLLDAVCITGVGIAAVTDNSLGDAVGNILLGNGQRRALHQVGGVDRCGGGRYFAYDQRQVPLGAVVPDSTVDSVCLKTLCGAYAALDQFHNLPLFSLRLYTQTGGLIQAQ